ncbi:hypothetical protein RSOLAG1IB_03107 [Rhizoctonia solani AG-1 IB]|uniref:Uncharacterized protein n=1 Tax=Thanatephorus cucumeris (strain AG1-IB / isolate 7/3/14) TaxID=1108050 RepID=A0A0B7FK38_THACB|nr:hypothetical protein RSOLAG1IB_03107 [Rhizoctonia solani AG-1 IB]
MTSLALLASVVHVQQSRALDNILEPDQQQTPLQIYKRWKKLHDQLSSAIGDYADTCAALATVASIVDQSTIENVFAGFDQDLHCLVENERKLTTTRQLLRVLRNRIPSLCSIGILPDEILGYIFELASVPCVRSNPKGRAQPHIIVCPELLSSVSTRWRQVAANTCSLWTHLDLIPTSDPSHKLYNRARIWLRRTKSAPLHVHIYQRNCAKREEVEQLTGFLALLMRNLHTLHIEADCYTTEVFETVLGCCIELGRPGSIKSLILRRPNSGTPLDHPGTHPAAEQLLDNLQKQRSYKHMNQFLSSLRNLRLHNVCIGQGMATLRELSELHLEAFPARAVLTISQLTATLRASPGIRSLKVGHTSMLDDLKRGEDCTEPIHLGKLECLSLLEAELPVLKWLLALIVPGKSPLSMSMKLYEQESILTELQSFFDRSTISTLYLDAGQQTWVPVLFGYMPHLRSLAVRSYHLSRNSFPKLSPEEVSSVRAPRLECLYFMGCRVGMRPLRNIIAAHSSTLRSLKLWRTDLYADSLSDVPDLGTDVAGTLSSLVPQFQRSHKLADYPLLGWEVSDDFRGHSNIFTP